MSGTPFSLQVSNPIDIHVLHGYSDIIVASLPWVDYFGGLIFVLAHTVPSIPLKCFA